MKLKIFKKVAAVFCAAIMTTSALGMSASAHPNTQMQQFVVQLDDILSTVSDIGIASNYSENEGKRQEIMSNLEHIQGFLANQPNAVDYEIVNNLSDQLSNLRNILANYKNVAMSNSTCIDLLHDRVLALYMYIYQIIPVGDLQEISGFFGYN